MHKFCLFCIWCTLHFILDIANQEKCGKMKIPYIYIICQLLPLEDVSNTPQYLKRKWLVACFLQTFLHLWSNVTPGTADHLNSWRQLLWHASGESLRRQGCLTLCFWTPCPATIAGLQSSYMNFKVILPYNIMVGLSHCIKHLPVHRDIPIFTLSEKIRIHISGTIWLVGKVKGHEWSRSVINVKEKAGGLTPTSSCFKLLYQGATRVEILKHLKFIIDHLPRVKDFHRSLQRIWS